MRFMTVKVVQDSFHYTLFDTLDETIICNGVFERIGMDACRSIIEYHDEQIIEEIEIENYIDAVHMLLDKLISLGIIQSIEDIDAIGHKLLFGGELFREAVFLSNEVLTQLEEVSFDGIMKNSILVIRAFMDTFTGIDMIGLFDTSFYKDLEEEAYLYGVPYSWYRDYGVRKFGYQGFYHQYMMEEVYKNSKKNQGKMITCYLDSYSSISAIMGDKCVDTSMGFSPLTGLMMGTRCGDVDPSIIPYIMEKEGKNVGEVLDVFNHNSGLLGISECSSDMRDIIALCDLEHPKVLLAKNKYIRSVVEYIAKYYVLLEGVDTIAFSGYIGENNRIIRDEICDKLKFLGVKIDKDLDSLPDKNLKISSEESSISIYVISSSEELMMVREMLKLKNR